MKQFITFVRKEFYHIFRDARTMMILLLMPIIQIILFGFAITTEVKNAKIAIYDPSKDISTQRIIERLQASDYFEVTRYLSSSSELNEVFKDGKVGLVVVFSDKFNETLMHTGKAQIQLLADATDPNTATTLTNYASAIIGSYQRDLMSQTNIPFQIIPETKLLYNPQMKGAYNFVPGVLGMILMLICAMMTSISIVREKELGTMEILLVSPMKPIYIILAKAVPYFFISCVNLATVLLLSVFVLGVPIAGSLFWLIIVCLIFIVVSLSLGLLVSTITDTQLAAMLVSGVVFLMPVMLLSGMMFPTENMPIVLQWISNIIPAKWFIIIVKDIMIKGVGIGSVWKEVLILCAMALVLIIVSLKKFKIRLE
ncbi:ABC transporter permease [Flavobacterium sp. 5]|uniref:ABC transporter permease n=1 Tax=Flavobacterium sp. 5 TaxID=2035199 RepID=UPI000C2C74E8|nr:ABC transporter permease [Flavobacterium sp. 5]PKB18446.1 ABC-2 type transport system permease protein [Flavobacterium sp. 5]